MQLNVRDKLHGFTVTMIQPINELNGIGYSLIHEKSGARLYYLQSPDDNKVFSITFRTPPRDNTGLPHILEHSVLCGSRKFPLKDPFVELAKGSMNTFLNAMTFSDKTMYPVASRNDQDLLNLMDVYLNAVFYPNLYEKPEILMQEGWHYHINSPEEPLQVKGVVYNEMKGAFSSPEQVLFRKIQESLFPDTPYGNESGGDPDYIPDLNQTDFVAFHQKYYHPSNAYLYLYGNGDMDQLLSFLDSQYLCSFKKTMIDSKIPLQTSFAHPRRTEVSYPVTSDESVEDKTYLSINYVTGDSTDPEKHLAMEMLNHLLLGTAAAPLKKKLLQSQLGKDVFGVYDSSIRQPVLSVVLKNSNTIHAEEFESLVTETLKELVDKGIDKELVEAVINIHEFKLREADYGRYPKGLVYHMKMMESWLHDEDPAMHLKYEKTLKKIRTSLTEPYFENVINEHLLNHSHRSLLIVAPEKGLNERKEKKLTDRLEDLKRQMDPQTLKGLIEQNMELESWQNAIHTEEELAVIPLLKREDINPLPERIPTETEQVKETLLLLHPLHTNQIQYVHAYIDLQGLTDQEIAYASLLSGFLGKLSTKLFSYEQLSNQINLHTGGIYFSTSVYPSAVSQLDNRYTLVIGGKCLTAKNDAFWDLVEQIVFDTRWDETGRMLEVLREMKSRQEMNLVHEGHMAAVRRAASRFSNDAYFKELTAGVAYYHFIAELEEMLQKDSAPVVKRLKDLYQKIFHSNRLIVSYTGELDELSGFKRRLLPFIDKLSKDSLGISVFPSPQNEMRGNEGLYLSSKVQYVAQASNFLNHGFTYTGSMQVLKTICSLDYLWKRIRVSGGAYGAMTGFSRNGNAFFVSYRDPNLKETLQVYSELPQYLKSFHVSDREMGKYIIGTMSRMDMPLTPAMKGEKGDAMFLTGLSFEMERVEREEILATQPATLRAFGEMVEKMIADHIYCVVGSESRLKENSHLFDQLIQVIR